MPYFAGFAILLILWLAIGFGATFNLAKIVRGEDGRPSTSKLQVFLWTAVVVFGYIAIYVAQVQAGQIMPPSIPNNVLIAMGVSVATAVAAKSITVKSIAAGNTKPAGSLGGILEDDSGNPDLSKIQLMVWTLIAIAVYLCNAHHFIAAPTNKLPDIDPTLMILMGLGHAGYLGTKVASS